VAAEPWTRRISSAVRIVRGPAREPGYRTRLIASRLSGGPFMSTDLSGDSLFRRNTAEPLPETDEARFEQVSGRGTAAAKSRSNRRKPTVKKAQPKPHAEADRRGAAVARARKRSISTAFGDFESHERHRRRRRRLPEVSKKIFSISLDTIKNRRRRSRSTD